MKEWKKYFDNRILERGKRYYESDRVFLISNRFNEWSFRVSGHTMDYRVNIIKTDDGYDFDCTCPYFEERNNCKHIAAAFYYLDNRNLLKETSEKLISAKSIFVKNDKKFRYYDINKIASNVVFSEKDYKKAQEIISKNEYQDFYVNFDLHSYYDDESFNNAYCEVSDGKYYPTKLTIAFNKKEIISTRCDGYGCPEFDNYYGRRDSREIKICVHQIVLLMLLDKYFDENNNRFDATSKNSEMVLAELKRDVAYSKNLPIFENEQQLNMDTQLILNGCFAYINFKIGYDKQYVISDIPSFMNKMDDNESMLFGSKTYLLLSKNNISEETKELYFILKRYCDNILSFNYFIKDRESENNIQIKKKDIEFAGKIADEVFEYFIKAKKQIKVDNRSIREKYDSEVIDTELRIVTIIEDKSKEYDDENCINVKVKFPLLYIGFDSVYFFDKNKNLCRCKKEKIKEIISILGYAKVKDISSTSEYVVDLVFGRNKISDFYNELLPILKLYGDVIDKTGDNIKSKVRSKVSYLFKIDYKNYLICRVYKIIDEKQIPLSPKNELDFEENDIILCIKKYFPLYDEYEDLFRSNEIIEEMYYILGVVIPYYMQIGEVEISENIKKLQKPKKATFSIGVSVKSDLVNLSVNSDELSKDEIEDLLNAYNKKVKYYKAKNNDIIDVQNSDLDFVKQLEGITGLQGSELLSKNISLPMYRSIYLDELLREKNDNLVERDEKFNEVVKNFDEAKNQNYELPKNINANLRGYQIEGYKWIRMLDTTGFCGILADEMGLGKTIQTISFLASLYENGEKNVSIIITPASLIYNWKCEFEKFAPKIKVIAVSGMQEERKQMIDDLKEYNVIITSYDLFKRDLDLYKDISFRCEIIDEAQYIKNQTTKASKSTKIINSKFRLALTGTPIENRLSELWSIFDYLMPEYLYNYSKFRKIFELPIIRDEDEEKLISMRKMIAPFVLRRKKEDVLKDLPEKIDNNYYLKMGEEQAKLYKVEAIKLKKMVMSSDYEKDKIIILSQITKLRQICCDPNLLYENYKGNSIKKDSCIALIKEAIDDGHKILLFSQFTTMLDILAKELKNENIKYYTITGKTSKNERVSLVDKFNNDETPIFLISLKAGGTGLNLVGADIVIHYDPWWNTSVQNQATDRAHRIGQKKIVNVYKLITKNTIEEKIIEMQDKKEKISNDLLSGELGVLSKLSKNELLDLIDIGNA